MAAIKALEQWCKIQCEGYRDVAITNMTTSFKSGLAFCALIHKFRPDLIDYDALNKEDVFKNNHMAFRVAEEQLGIAALLDAEDMVALRIPDRLSILTYVSQYHNYFRGRSPMGGVKRPAEGSKEEPSEKKNIPVVAKTFVSKTAIENRPPPSRIAETSPELPRPTDQEKVLVESSNKTGTLNSKCVVCKSHVHLVQRHFVEGKLYHRSCFKCSECSSVLLPGAYKVGKEPGSFICNIHQNTHIISRPPTAVNRTRPANIVVEPRTDSSRTHHTPWPSVLSAPVALVLKPADPIPAPHPWTASAQKTQAARQKFFQSVAPAPEPVSSKAKPAPPTDVPVSENVSLRTEEQKDRAWAVIGKKLAEENCNNNNARPFVMRSCERRFGEETGSADAPSWRQAKCGQSTAGQRAAQQAAQPANGYSHHKEYLWRKAVNKESTGPTTVSVNTKDPVLTEAPIDWRSNLKPVKNDSQLQIPVSSEGHSISLEKPKSEAITTSSPNVSTRAVKPPSRLPPKPPIRSPPPGLALYTAPSPQLPQRNSGGQHTSMGNHPTPNNCFSPPSSMGSPPLVPVWHRPSARQPRHSLAEGENGSCSPSKSPSSEPAMPSMDSPSSDHGGLFTSSGSKNGKYLSPTNASKSEMRSPSTKSHHIPMDEIEKELNEIEESLSDLERVGVEMEKKLRSCEDEGDGDILMDPLMVDWFNLIRKKQMFIRRESELVYIAKTQDLEEQQPGVEGELRRLLEKPDHLKSREESWREDRLMERLVEIVNGRNAIVDGLDEDRRREEEEDQQLNEMMQSLGVKKFKNKRKSSMSKLFRRRSKKLAVE